MVNTQNIQPNHKNKRQYGLTPTPYDSRDFALGGLFDLPNIENIPESIILEGAVIKDQGSTDFCSAYASCTISELQEGIELEPSWSFAKSKQISGDVSNWGQNLRTALKTHKDYGALPKDKCPFDTKTKTSVFLRDIENWPDLEKETWPFRKKSYVKVTGQYDHFDNARASIAFFQEEKRGIEFGVIWGWPINKFYLDTIPTNGFGHAVAVIGYTKLENGVDVLVIHNSYGKNAGVNGYFYITREVYNHFVNIYGAYMFIDISPEEAKKCYQSGIKLTDHWLVKLLKKLLKK